MSYTSLDNRVIDAAIATRVCGWKKRKHANGATRFYSPETWTYLDRLFETGHPDAFKWEPCPTEDFETRHDAPRYSTDYNAAHEALGRLSHEQLKLVAYVLMEKAPNAFDARVAWLLVVSPRQICEAILEALDKEATRG